MSRALPVRLQSMLGSSSLLHMYRMRVCKYIRNLCTFHMYARDGHKWNLCRYATEWGVILGSSRGVGK